MDYMTFGALLFIILFAVWGFFRGFWKSLAAIISLIAAYFASVLLATPCAIILSEHFGLGAVNDKILWGGASVGLFIVVSFVVRLAVTVLGKALPIDNLIINRSTGALLNGGYGTSMVVFIVWALAFSLETVDGATGIVAKMDVEGEVKKPLVVTWSRSIMSEILQWNAKSNGASAAVTEATKAFAENPSEVLGSIKSTLELQEFRALISNPALQELARNRDFDALKHSPEYEDFINHTSVMQLQALIMPSGTEESKNEVADYLLSIWHDVDIVKNDPEVMQMMQDSEVQSFLRGGASKVSVSLLGKGRDLLSLISKKAGDAASALNTEKTLAPMPVVYKWYDDNGVLNVTDLEHVPSDQRATAERVSQ